MRKQGLGPDPRELQGLISRACPGPCSSSSDRLRQGCICCREDCGFRRIAALTGLEAGWQIARWAPRNAQIPD
eukprot:6982755-Alexandrium_andersonii.AAC.1